MEPIGATTIHSLSAFGRFWLFAFRLMMASARGLFAPRDWRLLGPQFYEIGVRTVPVILITGTFVGLVMAVQVIDQLRAAGFEEQMGVLVNLSVVAELGPVLAGVMLAGRVGGALTAELGTMNVTEQIDAIRVMGTDPIRYLVFPRFIACMMLAPLLTVYCDLMGSLAGWFIAVKFEQVPSNPYWYFTAAGIELWDVNVGLFKSLCFGAAIGVIACYKGFHCRAGAAGVGRACMESFVVSFIAILIIDFFIAKSAQGTYKALFGFKSLIDLI